MPPQLQSRRAINVEQDQANVLLLLYPLFSRSSFRLAFFSAMLCKKCTTTAATSTNNADAIMSSSSCYWAEGQLRMWSWCHRQLQGREREGQVQGQEEVRSRGSRGIRPPQLQLWGGTHTNRRRGAKRTWKIKSKQNTMKTTNGT